MIASILIGLSVTLKATDAELVVAFLALAAGEASEQQLADWFRIRISAA